MSTFPGGQKVELEIEVPADFPERYRQPLAGKAEGGTVKRAIEAPPGSPLFNAGPTKESAMKKMMLALCLSAGLATTAMGAGQAAPEGPPMTTEQRQQMAGAHEKMAACLRSDRPVAECHEEIMKSCQETMGKACPMMGGMGHKGRGRMQKGN